MENQNILIDALKELLNIGIGRAANKLSQLAKSKVFIYSPEIEFLQANSFIENVDFFQKEFCSSSLKFDGEIKGSGTLSFEKKDGKAAADLILENMQISYAADIKRSEILNETGNICINSIVGTLCSMLDINVRLFPPIYIENNFVEIFSFLTPSKDDKVLIIRSTFQIRDKNLKGFFIFMLSESSYLNILEKIRTKYENIFRL